MGSPCEGTPREMASFAGQLQVPMCSRHRAEHMVVLYLNNNPEEVIKALNKEEDASVIDLLMDCSAEKRDEMFKEISGYEYINRDFAISLLSDNMEVADLVNLSDKELFEQVEKKIA